MRLVGRDRLDEQRRLDTLTLEAYRVQAALKKTSGAPEALYYESVRRYIRRKLKAFKFYYVTIRGERVQTAEATQHGKTYVSLRCPECSALLNYAEVPSLSVKLEPYSPPVNYAALSEMIFSAARDHVC